MVFTELYVAKRHVRTSELTLERCLADWEEVKRTLAAIAAESTWAPTPSPLCEWCPFNGNGREPTREVQNLSLWWPNQAARTGNDEGLERSRSSSLMSPIDPAC